MIFIRYAWSSLPKKKPFSWFTCDSCANEKNVLFIESVFVAILAARWLTATMNCANNATTFDFSWTRIFMRWCKRLDSWRSGCSLTLRPLNFSHTFALCCTCCLFRSRSRPIEPSDLNTKSRAIFQYKHFPADIFMFVHAAALQHMLSATLLLLVFSSENTKIRHSMGACLNGTNVSCVLCCLIFFLFFQN